MGIFGDLRTLKKQADEIGKNFDPAAQMRSGMASMQAATAALNQQAAAATVHQTGQPGTATILSVVDTGTRVNHDAMVTLQLLVELPGRPPYPVTTTALIPYLAIARATPGNRVAIAVDPTNPHTVALDWNR